MPSSEYDMTVYVTILAIAIAEQLTTDELFVLAIAVTQLGETLETIAIQRERVFHI